MTPEREAAERISEFARQCTYDGSGRDPVADKIEEALDDARAEVRRLREELATVTRQRDAARKALEPFAETGNYLLKIEWTEDSYEEIHRTDEWTAAARALSAP